MVKKALILMTNYKHCEYAFLEIAHVPLFKRIIFSGQKAGINEFLIHASVRKRHEIEAALKFDKRVRSKINIMDFPNQVKDGEKILKNVAHAFEENFFIIKGNTIFDHRLLQDFSQIKDEKSMAFDAKDNLCVEIVSKQQLQECEIRLYNSLDSSLDGPIVDKYINRRISRLITKQLVKIHFTPNQTTFLSMVIGFVAAWFFWQGGYWNSLAGGLVFQLAVILDHCDGEVARLKFMESRIGGWFDAFCDSTIRTFIILGMTGSLYIETKQSLVLILGILSSIGIFVSTMLSSYETFKKDEDIAYKNKESTNASTEEENKLSTFIDKFNNADSFSIILFICILSGQLVWFLWTVGIGSFVFTLVILTKSFINKLVHSIH